MTQATAEPATEAGEIDDRADSSAPLPVPPRVEPRRPTFDWAGFHGRLAVSLRDRSIEMGYHRRSR